MSAIVTTTTTTTYYEGGKFPGYIPPPYPGNEGGAYDIGGGGYGNMKPDQIAAWINNLPVPDGIKNYLRNMMGVGTQGALPSDASAAKTINQFQKDHDIGLLSVQQMQQIAETGYFTDKNGKTIQAPPEVQAAAQAFMANNGALFKKMESATDGKHDGQLGMGDYDKAISAGTISSNPADPATSSRPQVYGIPSGGFMDAVMNGHVSPNRPSEYGAAKTINQFQQDHDIGLLNISQMHQIAETGYFTDKNGKTIQVPPEVQAAAQTFMANNAELFKKLESATDGKHDGQLGMGDFGEAKNDGTISPYNDAPPPYSPYPSGNQPGAYPPPYQAQPGAFQPGMPQGGAPLPSESGAAKTINQFQNDHDIQLISAAQMQQIAETGYFTDKNGKSIQAPPEVQAAAQAFMANNGELFKKMEAAKTGKHDGELGKADYQAAIDDGTISSGNGGPPVVDRTGQFGAPQNGGYAPPPYSVQPPAYQPGAYPPGMPQGGTPLPSESGAAKTINQFQNDHDIQLISAAQMQQIAETGYFTDKNGKSIQAPPEVQAAAQAFMANNGELFKKMEAAKTGKHDGELGKADYQAAIDDGTISSGNGGPPVVDRTGQFGAPQNGGYAPPPYSVQPPAYQPGAYPPGMPQGGAPLPSDSSAAKTIHQFQDDHDIQLISAAQMQQIAETGYFTDKNGKTIQVPPEVQAAAQAYMANNGELFKKMESAKKGEFDGELGKADYQAAIDDGTISA